MDGENLDLKKYDLPQWAQNACAYSIFLSILMLGIGAVLVRMDDLINSKFAWIPFLILTCSVIISISIAIWGTIKERNFLRRQLQIRQSLKP